jgi:hypothetical protein
VSALGVEALDRLPVGSVLLARHKRHQDVAVWVKTDDTELPNEFGDGPESTAWMSSTYTADRRAAELVEESSSIRVIWFGDDDMDKR